MDILEHPSPNCGDRRGDGEVSLVVLHYTGMESAEAALERLCDEAAEVSAHYLIEKSGTVRKLVDEAKRAWHAGEGSWGGEADVNSRSIGIELDNDGQSLFEEAQMAALEVLLADVMARHALPAKAVIGHADMAPDRKGDPGPRFDWRRLERKGLAVPAEPAAGDDDFLRNAEVFGYPVAYGETHILRAFRDRFRPGATGPLNAADRSMMAGLARRHPA